MKQKMKILSALSLTLLLLFSSCEKDLYDEPAYQEKYKLERIPISKLLKNEKFKKTFYKTFKTDYQSKFSVNKGIFNRETEGYIITDSVANVASFENNISYNFKIEYPSKPTSDTIFNLVVYEDELGNAENYITKNLEINQILTPVEITDSNDVSKGVLDCIDIITDPRFFKGEVIVIDWGCVDSYNNTGGGGTGSGTGGTGSGTGSGTGGSGSGSGAGSNSGGPILTSPVGGGGALSDENILETPCSQLKKLTNTASIKLALKNLKDNHLNTNSEFGYSVSTFNNSTSIAPPTVIQASTSNPHEIVLPSGGNIIGALHVHTINGSLMFSAADIRSLCVMAFANSNDLDCSTFFVTLTTNDGTFALKIDDFSALLIAMKGEQYANFKNDLDKEYKSEDLPHTSVAFQKVLLKVMQNNNVGVSLYKASDDLSAWSKLSLDPTDPNNDPIATLCE